MKFMNGDDSLAIPLAYSVTSMTLSLWQSSCDGDEGKTPTQSIESLVDDSELAEMSTTKFLEMLMPEQGDDRNSFSSVDVQHSTPLSLFLSQLSSHKDFFRKRSSLLWWIEQLGRASLQELNVQKK